MPAPPVDDPHARCLCDVWPPAPHCPTHPDQGDTMNTLPPHPGLSGLAAREAAAARIANAVDPEAAARAEYPEFTALLEEAPWPPPTTPADITRAADDDADHEGLTRAGWAAVNAQLRTRAALDRVAALNRAHGLYDDPAPCGCCGPQLCCCDCHKEEA